MTRLVTYAHAVLSEHGDVKRDRALLQVRGQA
jgi:hypothetical protein